MQFVVENVVDSSHLGVACFAIRDTFATWTQCFALYTAAIAAHDPKRVPDLMAYMSTIAKASLKFRWPSWVVYDDNFRSAAADKLGTEWAKVDPSLYSVTNQQFEWLGHLARMPDNRTPKISLFREGLTGVGEM